MRRVDGGINQERLRFKVNIEERRATNETTQEAHVRHRRQHLFAKRAKTSTQLNGTLGTNEVVSHPVKWFQYMSSRLTHCDDTRILGAE